MIYQNDQLPFIPKAFIFPQGQAHLETCPVNDNRSARRPLLKNPVTWGVIGALLTGIGIYFL